LREVLRPTTRVQQCNDNAFGGDIFGEYTSAPMSLDGIVGQDVITESLHKHMLDGETGGAIILFGPEGVGKLTIALTYARILLCENSAGKNYACGECSACAHFAKGGSWGFGRLDAAKESALEGVRDYIKRVGLTSFANHKVLIVENAERAPRVVEACLKTLEDKSEATTFIFLVQDNQAFSAPGQSRSQLLRVRRLNNVDALELCLTFLRSPAGNRVEDKTLELIVAEGQGLPGRLRSLCDRVKRASAYSLSEAQRVLSLDWGDQSITYWYALLQADDPKAQALELPASTDAHEAVRRVRSVLVELDNVSRSQLPKEAALRHATDALRELSEMLADRASDKGASRHELWSRLANHWNENDWCDALGFVQAGWRTRGMIR
jgi:DNA polymerase III gamma/tau subunit